MDLETVAILISLFGGLGSATSIIWSWFKNRRETTEAANQHRASIVGDLDKVRKAIGEDYERLTEENKKRLQKIKELQGRIDQLEQENACLHEKVEELRARLKATEKAMLQEKHERGCLEERLDLEREVYSRRLEALEVELNRLNPGCISDSHDTTPPEP